MNDLEMNFEPQGINPGGEEELILKKDTLLRIPVSQAYKQGQEEEDELDKERNQAA